MREVQHTSELDRILSLPTRSQSNNDLIDSLTRYLTKPEHVCSDKCAGGAVRLLPLQADALIEAHDQDGLFLQGPIGCGKTLTSMLLPAVFEAKRPLLVVPGGSLYEKTILDLRLYRQHWRIPPIEIKTYQFLSLEQHADFLEKFNPDLIIFDEAHKTKSKKSAITRRMKRFRDRHPDVPVCIMSGTPAKRSMKDFAHALWWAMRKQCPVPIRESDVHDWASVVDAGIPWDQRLAPGALKAFGNSLQSIRQGLRGRIFNTPGCLASQYTPVDAKLIVTLRNVPLTAKEDEPFKELYENWTTPDNHEFFDAKDLWRYARQLALGHFSVWDPRPPEEWLSARKDYFHACREILSRSRKLDTEKQVVLYLIDHPDHEAYPILLRWRDIKDTFKPKSVPTWTGDTALQYAASWAKDGGIIWTEHVAFGMKLSEETGIPYFGQEGLTPDGRHFIQTYKGPVMIASWHANGTGHNLQRYNRCLLTSIYPTGLIIDQTIGRIHRPGQKSSEVYVDIPISCREQLDGFERAREEDGPFHHDLLFIPSKLALDATVKYEQIRKTGSAWTGKRK